MLPLAESIIRRFAEELVSGRKGFSLREIGDYFREYQPNIPSHEGVSGLTKPAYFLECVLSLTPADQRCALLDLCNDPPQSKHPMPEEVVRLRLRGLLFQAHGRSPVGNRFSAISLRGVREGWWKVASRMPASPSGAITAARTLLESTCKTILCEIGETPDKSGEIARLVKQTREAVGVSETAKDQPTKQIFSGVTSIVLGVGGLSNLVGDRHGQVGGEDIKDVPLAELVIHCCGAVAVFLTQRFLLSQLDSSQDR
jgi:hypothetical protein